MTTPLLVAFALLFAVALANLVATAVLAWRKPVQMPVDHHGLRLARAAYASARASNPTLTGEELLRRALAIFGELDLSEDGKRDFTDRQAGLFLRAAKAEAEAES